MDEEQTAKRNEQEKAVSDADEGLQSKTTSELDRADQIAERLKRENDRREALLSREENLEARRKVGGIAEAGQQPVKKEISDEDYANKALTGEIEK